MNSAIYVGRLAHVRLTAKRHAFARRMYMLYLDLDEIAQLPSTWLFGIERARPLSFRRADYLGRPDRSLIDEVRDEVERALGERPRGPIRLLTQVRSFGYAFNPVSFYYCYAEDGDTLHAIVAEITNTPWGERHRYVLRAGERGASASFPKAFHVSPFFAMQQDYDWRFESPGQRLTVRMTNREAGRTVFRAHLGLQRRPLSTPNLLRVALRLPLMSWQALVAIYVHALLLWLKGTPFHGHPASPEPRALKEHS